MIHKMLDSTRSGMTRTFSHVPSIYDNDFLELVWENGEVVVRGGSSNRSTNTNHDERIYEDAGITKTRLNPFDSLEAHFAPQRGDSDMSSSHQSCAQDSSQSSQNKNSSKLDEQFANLLRPVKDSKPNNSHCLPSSSPLKKQRSDSTQTPPATNTRNLGCECHHKTTKSNFYNFSIPAVFVKSTTHQGNSATQQTKHHSSLARVEEIEALKVEKSSQGFQNQTSLTVERSERPPPPVDEHSQAIGLHTSQAPLRSDQNPRSEPLRTKPKAYNNTDMCHEPLLASSSVCSLGASNDPNLSIRKHEDTDDSTYLSDNEGEPEDMVKQEREGSRVKRSRNAEVHNLSEQKRREKINKKMRTLKELIPNCNKVDKASMLDDAIDYLKTLKLQLQIMSMGNGLWPYMMLPAAAAHHMNGAHLPQLVGAGMGFRPPQLPIPPLSAITDNRLQMVGFPNQIAPISMPHAPFFPIIGNSATQPHLASTTVATANLAEHLANSASSLQISVPNNMNPLEHTTKQAPNQVSFQHHINSNPQLPLSFFHKSRGM